MPDDDLRNRLRRLPVFVGELGFGARRRQRLALMLEDSQRRRRSRHRVFWRLINPPTRPLAGLAPWWVLLETKGRLTGEPRRTPLARGPIDGDAVWLAAVHGRHALWVRNLETTPEVRLKMSGRWHDGRATVHEFDEAIGQRFNLYARTGPRTLGIAPVLIRVQLKD